MFFYLKKNVLDKIIVFLVSLSAGALIGGAFLHLLPEASREIEIDTYQLAVSNLLISTGHSFDTLESGDSIREPIMDKYDIILSNPPFGIKGLIYNEIDSKLRDEYMPIVSNSAVPLFLQAIINILNNYSQDFIIIEYNSFMQKEKELKRLEDFVAHPLKDQRDPKLYRNDSKRTLAYKVTSFIFKCIHRVDVENMFMQLNKLSLAKD